MSSNQMSRALRRHHTTRLKHARRHYWGEVLRLDARRLGMAIATPAACSCTMCGNPRKYFGERSLQERRFSQRGPRGVEGADAVFTAVSR